MKKYIRGLFEDLKLKSPRSAPTTHLVPPPEAPLPEDLNNQELSDDPEQRTRQLEFQAQKSEERQRLF